MIRVKFREYKQYYNIQETVRIYEETFDDDQDLRFYLLTTEEWLNLNGGAKVVLQILEEENI